VCIVYSWSQPTIHWCLASETRRPSWSVKLIQCITFYSAAFSLFDYVQVIRIICYRWCWCLGSDSNSLCLSVMVMIIMVTIMVLFIVHIPASGLRPPPPTHTSSMCERVFLPGMGLRVGSTPEIHFMVFLCKSLKLGGGEFGSQIWTMIWIRLKNWWVQFHRGTITISMPHFIEIHLEFFRIFANRK